jgi:tetratricopeptide (TPR) repeat protein
MAHCGIVMLQVAKEYDLGMAVLRAAAETNPNHLIVATAAAVGHLHCGKVEDAIALLHRTIRLSPRDPLAFVTLTGMAHAEMILGNYADALDWAARSLALNAEFDPTYWMLIAANAHLGRLDEARHYLAIFQSVSPGVTTASIRAGQPDRDPSRLAAILDGLRLAGLDER